MFEIPEPRQYESLPVKVTAIQADYSSIACMLQIIRWVNQFNGHVKFKFEMKTTGPHIVEMELRTLEVWVPVSDGSYVVRGTMNEFYPVNQEVMAQRWKAVIVK